MSRLTHAACDVYRQGAAVMPIEVSRDTAGLPRLLAAFSRVVEHADLPAAPERSIGRVVGTLVGEVHLLMPGKELASVYGRAARCTPDAVLVWTTAILVYKNLM
jgi:hypothetical protein